MSPVNEFLKVNVEKLTGFFYQISRPGATEEVAKGCKGSHKASAARDLVEVHQALLRHSDRFHAVLVEICLKQNISIASIRQQLASLRTILSQLGPVEVPYGSADQRSICATTLNTIDESSTRRQSLARSELSIAQTAKVIYYAGLSLAGRPVLSLILRKLQAWSWETGEMWTRDILKVVCDYSSAPFEVLLDITGFSSTTNHTWVDLFFELLPSEAMNNLQAIYLFNTNNSFVEYLQCNLPTVLPLENISIRPFTTGEDISHYLDLAKMTFDNVVSDCNVDVTVFESVTRLTTLGVEELVHAKISSSTSLLVLWEQHKLETLSGLKLNVADTISIKDISDIQIAHQSITITSKSIGRIVLKTSQASELGKHIKHLLSSSTESSNRSLSSGDQEQPDVFDIEAILLSVGLVKLTSECVSVRQAALDLLCQLLPARDIRNLGISAGNNSAVVPFGKLELTSLHVLALRKHTDAVYLSRMVRHMLRALSTIDATAARSDCIRCIRLWLTTLLKSPEYDPTHDLFQENRLSDLFTLLLNAHCTAQDDLFSDLWTVIQAHENLHDTVCNTLLPFAITLEHDSPHVERIGRIFREVRSQSLHTRLVDDIMALVHGETDDPRIDRSHSSSWPATLTLLRILADSMARSAIPTLRLAEVLYIVLACLRIGSEGQQYVFFIFKNLVSITLTAPGLSSTNTRVLQDLIREIVGNEWMFWQQTRQARGSPSGYTDSIAARASKDIMAADALAKLVGYMLTLIKAGAATPAEENKNMSAFSSILTECAFSAAPTQRRAFIALGPVASELSASGTSQPVLEALSVALRQATVDDARLAASIIFCLSSMPDPHYLLWLALALCGFPIAAVSAAGLRLLVRGLESLDQLDGPLTLNQAFEQTFRTVRSRWSRLERCALYRTSVSKCKRSFGVCCALMQIMRMLEGTCLEVVKRVLVLLIKLHLKHEITDKEHPIPPDALPYLVFLKCLASNSQELHQMLASTGLLDAGFKVTKETDLQSAAIKQCRLPDDDYAILLLSLLMNLLRLADTPPETLRVLQILSEAVDTKLPASAAIRSELLPIVRVILCKSHQSSLLRVASRILLKVKSDRRSEEASPTSTSKKAMLEALGFSFLHKEQIEQSSQQLEIYKASIISVIEQLADAN